MPDETTPQTSAQAIYPATHRLAPGHGHISLVTRYREEILDDLMKR